MQSDRNTQVDALRGLAAMCVVVEHAFVNMTPPKVGMFSKSIEAQEVLQWLTHTVFNGRAAVLLFFVISGYAMKHQWERQAGKPFSRYLVFLVRRAFRIFPAMWVSIAFCWLLAWLYTWPLDLSLHSVYLNLTAQGSGLNWPLWSIIVELKCSVLFPFLMIAHRQGSPARHILIFSALLAMLCINGADSYNYLVFFYSGALLHDYGAAMIKIVGRGALPLTVASIMAFGLLPQLWVFSNRYFVGGYYQVAEIIPCTFILLMVTTRRFPAINWALDTRPLVFIGTISYSIYLLNWPVAGAFWASFIGPAAPFWGYYYLVEVAFFFFITTINLALATLLYYYVENPFNRIGKRAARYIETSISTARRVA